MREMTPPLPAASRPSKRIATLSPLALTYSCEGRGAAGCGSDARGGYRAALLVVRGWQVTRDVAMHRVGWSVRGVAQQLLQYSSAPVEGED